MSRNLDRYKQGARSAACLHHVATFLQSTDLAQLVLVCKDWCSKLHDEAYELHFDGRSHQSPVALSSFLAFFTAAKSLSFVHVTKTDLSAFLFPQLLRNVRSIAIDSCGIDGDFMSLPLRELRRLSINPKHPIDSTALLTALQGWPYLSELSLSRCIHLRDSQFMMLLKDGHTIRKLSISHAHRLLSPDLTIRADSSVVPSDSAETSHSDESKAICPLTHLALRKCARLTLSTLLPCHSLTSNIYLTRIRFPNLISLDLSFTAISSAIVQVILAEAPVLQELFLVQCLSLDATQTTLTSVSLVRLSLKQCISLRQLQIVHCPALRDLDLLLCRDLAELTLDTLPSLPRLDLQMLSNLQTLRIHALPRLHTLLLNGCQSLGTGLLAADCCDDQLLPLSPTAPHTDPGTSRPPLPSLETVQIDDDANTLTTNDAPAPMALVRFLMEVARECPHLSMRRLLRRQVGGTLFQPAARALLHEIGRQLPGSGRAGAVRAWSDSSDDEDQGDGMNRPLSELRL